MTGPAAAYEALRASTAEMLRLDPANLSLVEGLQLDLIALLRLTTSDMQGAAVSGGAVDLDRLSTALQMLQKLLPEKSLVASAPTPETRFGPSARERLRKLIEKTVLTDGAADREREAALMLKEEEMALAAAAFAAAGGDASGGGVLPPSPSRAPDHAVRALENLQPGAAAATADAQKRRDREHTPSNPPPGPKEPWRDYVNSDGIVAPWFRGYG